jgi:hypothetical protein
MSLTAANCVFMITIPGLFDTPVQLQGFGVDEVADGNVLDSSETMMGVDGEFTGGFVFMPFEQGVTLLADSESVFIFDQWYAQQQALLDTLTAEGLIVLPSLGKKWTLSRGFLIGYKPIPDIKKLAQQQKFAIRWKSVVPSIA